MITAIEQPLIRINTHPKLTSHAGIAQRLKKYNVDFSRASSDPSNIFYFECDDDQMRYFGIRKESLIVVDRSIEVTNNMIVVCCVDGEWLTRKMLIKGNNTFLCINDGLDACLNITGKQIDVLGAVTWVCQPFSAAIS